MLQSRQSRSIADRRRSAARALVPLSIGRVAGLVVALAVGLAAAAPQAGAQTTVPPAGALGAPGAGTQTAIPQGGGLVAPRANVQTAVPQSGASVFTVSDIEVDATASDAVSARAQAIRQGQQAGLDRLLRRLVPAEEQANLPRAANLPIDDYVQSFQIANEELSSTRYIADLTVAYDPDAVRTLLGDGGFAFAQSVSVPVVVLPLYETGQDTRLWPDGNPWWQAWAEHMDPEQLLRLVLPLGDLEDMAMVSAAQARAGDAAALGALAARYGAEDTLVVTARTEGGPEPEQVSAVQFEARRIGAEQRLEGQPLSLAVGPDRPLDATLALAVEEIQASLDERWKSANLLRYDQGGLMLVRVPIARLADWIAVKQRLERLPEVSEIVMTSFARDQVDIRIRYIGDELHLEQALARLDLALTREGESWLLLPTGRNPGQGGQPSATSTAS